MRDIIIYLFIRILSDKCERFTRQSLFNLSGIVAWLDQNRRRKIRNQNWSVNPAVRIRWR